MSIKVTCLQCGATNSVNDRLAGKRVRCPKCDTVVHLPEAETPVTTEAIDDGPIEAIAVDAEPVEVEAIEVAAETVDASPTEADARAGQALSTPVVASPLGVEPPSPPPTESAVQFDDDDEDEEPFAPRKKLEDDELDMTSMVDVTFLLLIFFVVTASFQLQKSIMMPRQQTDAPSTSAVEEDPEELDQVELQIDERGAFLVLAADWEAETPGKQNLISKLKEALGDNETKLVIKVQEQAKLQSLVDGMDAGTIAGYTEIIVTQVEDFD